jgi:drug/metabolite transporter (DMT)-like permease
VLTILLALLAAATNAFSSVLQRKANVREVEAHHTGAAGLTGLLRQPAWLAGIAAMIVSFLLQAGALSIGELSTVQPLMAMELPITLLLASILFRHPLGRSRWIGIGMMTVGMAVFLLALAPTEGQPGRPDGLAWSLAVGSTGAVVLLLVLAAYRLGGQTRAALLGAASGVCFALTAVFMAAALVAGPSWAMFGRWHTYLVGVAGLLAVLLLQEGMRAGSLIAVQPGVTLVDPVVAVLLGVLLFAERVRTGGWIVVEVISAVVVGWAALRLSRSPVPGPGDGDSGGPGRADDAGHPRAAPQPRPSSRS